MGFRSPAMTLAPWSSMAMAGVPPPQNGSTTRSPSRTPIADRFCMMPAMGFLPQYQCDRLMVVKRFISSGMRAFPRRWQCKNILCKIIQGERVALIARFICRNALHLSPTGQVRFSSYALSVINLSQIDWSPVISSACDCDLANNLDRGAYEQPQELL